MPVDHLLQLAKRAQNYDVMVLTRRSEMLDSEYQHGAFITEETRLTLHSAEMKLAGSQTIPEEAASVTAAVSDDSKATQSNVHASADHIGESDQVLKKLSSVLDDLDRKIAQFRSEERTAAAAIDAKDCSPRKSHCVQK
jgi:hypothetical protein